MSHFLFVAVALRERTSEESAELQLGHGLWGLCTELIRANLQAYLDAESRGLVYVLKAGLCAEFQMVLPVLDFSALDALLRASSALGAALEAPQGVDATACDYLAHGRAVPCVLVMIEQRRIARVDVRSGTLATEEGARIGDSAERIQQLYAGRVTASPHKYTDGEDLTVVPVSPADSAFRLISRPRPDG